MASSTGANSLSVSFGERPPALRLTASHGFAVAVGLLVLEDDFLVRFHAQPVQALEDRGDGGFGRTLAIGVLDANKELPSRVTCI